MVHYLSVAGKHHNYENENNQDAIQFMQKGKFCAMVLADGVSTCSQAKYGAETACKAVVDFLLQHAERFFNMNERDTADSLIAHILYELRMAAEKAHKKVEEYSSTLACILVDRSRHRMFYFSIGDSLITATKNDKCYIVAMPADSRNGCCVTTSFNAVTMARTGIIDTDNIQSVMISSDGAWHLMYQRNRLLQPIKAMILNKDYEKLKETLLEQERFDDCSFITIDLKEFLRRKPA